jgi:biopolymer transport protein ExbD
MREPLVQSTPLSARINVTPIIDVALVLVIILLITAPMMAVADLGVTLPAAKTRGAEDERRISITLNPYGELALDEAMVAYEELAMILTERFAEAGDEEMLVVVRADSGVTHAAVREVLTQIRASGAKRVAIGTRQSGGTNP